MEYQKLLREHGWIAAASEVNSLDKQLAELGYTSGRAALDIFRSSNIALALAEDSMRQALHQRCVGDLAWQTEVLTSAAAQASFAADAEQAARLRSVLTAAASDQRGFVGPLYAATLPGVDVLSSSYDREILKVVVGDATQLEEEYRAKLVRSMAGDAPGHASAASANELWWKAAGGSSTVLEAGQNAAFARAGYSSLSAALYDVGKSAAAAFGLDKTLTCKAIADYEAQFRSLKATELAKLAEVGYASAVGGMTSHSRELQKAMEAMQSPWIDRADARRSFAAFADLYGIGHGINSFPSFDDEFTKALRRELGDWRDRINWSEQAVADPVTRGRLYVERGFDPALTDFPASAFFQALDLASLSPAFLPVVRQPRSRAENVEHSQEEESLTRTNQAHDWLLRFEVGLRWFIHNCMAATFGPNWERKRLPNGLYDDWQTRRESVKDKEDQQWPLIFYADFTHYEQIICKADNWRDVFRPVFGGRIESVRESLQRLYPVRNPTMHARPLTQDDFLMLCVEVKRLTKPIQKSGYAAHGSAGGN